MKSPMLRVVLYKYVKIPSFKFSVNILKSIFSDVYEIIIVDVFRTKCERRFKCTRVYSSVELSGSDIFQKKNMRMCLKDFLWNSLTSVLPKKDIGMMHLVDSSVSQPWLCILVTWRTAKKEKTQKTKKTISPSTEFLIQLVLGGALTL